MNDVTAASPFSAQLEASILESGIPPRPAAIDLIAQEMRKDSPDFRLLAKAFRSDVALSAGLVKMANAVGFSVQHRVTTVLEAMEIMGLRAMSRAVACIALKSAFPDVNLERFWDGSMQVANLSAWLVGQKRWGGITADEAYTFGLFRDCGIAVLLQRMPEYENVLRQANSDAGQSFTAIEESVLPTNHARVGAALAKSWWLSDDIVKGILQHHNPKIIDSGFVVGQQFSSRGGKFVAISQLGEYLYQRCTGLSRTNEWQKLGKLCLGRLAICESELDDLCDLAKKELENA